MNITVGDQVTIFITNRADQARTEIRGQVTGVAESYFKPDQLRILIAGLDNWIDLEDKIVLVNEREDYIPSAWEMRQMGDINE